MGRRVIPGSQRFHRSFERWSEGGACRCGQRNVHREMTKAGAIGLILSDLKGEVYDISQPCLIVTSNTIQLINLVPYNVSSANHLSAVEDEVGFKTVDADFGPLPRLRKSLPVIDITGTGE